LADGWHEIGVVYKILRCHWSFEWAPKLTMQPTCLRVAFK
jgi:hypothetical protein